MRSDPKNYDFQKKKKANVSATFRCLVSVYLIYLGVRLMGGGGGEGEPPVWAARLTGGAFILAAVGFIWYTRKTYKAELKDAELPEDEELPEDTGD